MGGLAPSEIGVLAGLLADVEAMACAKVRRIGGVKRCMCLC
jgi:hypothetical protein